MERIAWNESFSVGVGLLDHQHARILGVVDLLLSHPGADVGDEVISEALTRLTRYAQEHFQTEEELLAEHGYPDLGAQKAAHAAYRRRLVAFCGETMAAMPSLPEELLLYGRDWWERHILQQDMKYRSFLTERGVA